MSKCMASLMRMGAFPRHLPMGDLAINFALNVIDHLPVGITDMTDRDNVSLSHPFDHTGRTIGA